MRTLKISLLVFILSITIPAQWYQQNSGTTRNFYYAQFVNDMIGWAVTNYTSTNQLIYKTADGGQNWQLQYTFAPQNPIFKIFFSNENVGWVITWTTGSTLLKTVDGGENWLPVYSYQGATDYINDFVFINPDTGWFVGEQTISLYENGITEFPTIFKETTNGGINWIDKNFTPNPIGGLREIEAIDYLTLFVAGYDTLYKTSNGGNNWERTEILYSYDHDFKFFSVNLGWARITGILMRTTNGGISWAQQFQQCNSYHFILPSFGWCASGNDIYHSTNGGDYWTLQNSNTINTLNDIFFIDTNNGWAVGQNGTILHTNNGGTPVELISFTSTTNVNEVTLYWSTATETNNSGFEILRSAKENDWGRIGFVLGHGTTTEPQHYSFTDKDVKPGKYQYRLKQIDYDGSFEYSQIVEVEIPFINEFSLSQNYPNPFNPTTKIKFTIPTPPVSSPLVKGRTKEGFATLKVYDILGRQVATLVNEEIRQRQTAGEYEVEFNAAELPSGIYFYQLKAGQYSETKKMILLR